MTPKKTSTRAPGKATRKPAVVAGMPELSLATAAPAALLSGTFYSVDKLAPAFQMVSHANPFFYAISGFRYGFIGTADSPVEFGAWLLLGINVALGTLCYLLLRSGWKLRA